MHYRCVLVLLVAQQRHCQSLQRWLAKECSCNPNPRASTLYTTVMNSVFVHIGTDVCRESIGQCLLQLRHCMSCAEHGCRRQASTWCMLPSMVAQLPPVLSCYMWCQVPPLQTGAVPCLLLPVLMCSWTSSHLMLLVVYAQVHRPAVLQRIRFLVNIMVNKYVHVLSQHLAVTYGDSCLTELHFLERSMPGLLCSLSLYGCLSVCLSVCLCICLSVRPSVWLSTHAAQPCGCAAGAFCMAAISR